MQYQFMLLFKFICLLLGSVEGTWFVKEEFLSPAVTEFDCHSSSIVETAPGHFFAVWTGGAGIGKSNGEIEENVAVWGSLFDGKTWSIPERL